jgi:hypothetical protein
VPEPIPVPRFHCPVPHVYGHSCNRERGHRGGHTCECGQGFTAAPSRPILHHDLTTMTFPESDAA